MQLNSQDTHDNAIFHLINTVEPSVNDNINLKMFAYYVVFINDVHIIKQPTEKTISDFSLMPNENGRYCHWKVFKSINDQTQNVENTEVSDLTDHKPTQDMLKLIQSKVDIHF